MNVTEYRAKAARAMSEDELQNNIIQLAKLYGWMFYHTRDSRGSQAGFPDLVLVRRGQLVFAELKTKTGRMTPAQHVWADELNMVEHYSDGAVQTFLWRPSDWLSGEIQKVLA